MPICLYTTILNANPVASAPMNIITDQLQSKPNTQSLLTYFLDEMKHYFQKTPLLNEDKTYARVLRMAETNQKCMPHFYSITNIALKLVKLVKTQVDDKLEDQKLLQEEAAELAKKVSSSDSDRNEDLETIERLYSKISAEKDTTATATTSLNRSVDQDFLRNLLIDSIGELAEEITESESQVVKQLNSILRTGTNVVFYDSHLSNLKIVTKVAAEKSIDVTVIKVREANHKNKEISLAEAPAEIRKKHTVIISAEAILKNGSIIAESGALMVALAAKKYNIPVVVISRGFALTEKTFIDQYVLLAENPMKLFKKSEETALKVYIGKRFDLIQARLINEVVTQQGVVSPSNLDLHFAAYYDYN